MNRKSRAPLSAIPTHLLKMTLKIKCVANYIKEKFPNVLFLYDPETRLQQSTASPPASRCVSAVRAQRVPQDWGWGLALYMSVLSSGTWVLCVLEFLDS